MGEYYFDGDGKRVKNNAPTGEVTVFVYDAGGNVIADPQGRTFIYDAENKQVEVESSQEHSGSGYRDVLDRTVNYRTC